MSVAVSLRAEAEAFNATVYQTLDEWGIHGARRSLLKRMVLALQAGISETERLRMEERVEARNAKTKR